MIFARAQLSFFDIFFHVFLARAQIATNFGVWYFTLLVYNIKGVLQSRYAHKVRRWA